ncbi:MAG TPA: putative glycoside hydrolase [Steroidobacteraceae bacterium]|nr:putative glycoside hydrolase [Steroidobacteraceae bacterium]
MLRNPFRHGLTALAAVAALATCASAAAFTPPSFPRIAGIQVGGPFNYNDPSYQAEMAKQAITVMNFWPGMAPGRQSMQSVIQAIKSANPNALVFMYVDSDEQFTDAAGSADASLRTQLDNMKWWLYTDTSERSVVASFYGDGGDTINNTPYTPKDSSGDDSVDYITKWFVNNYYSAMPNIDGLFMDNVFLKPRVAGDWYRNGQVLQASDAKAQAAIQAGYERYFGLVRALMPGKYQIGNVATWYQPGQPAVPAGYQGMTDGGLIEGLIGQSWSTESWAGWQSMENQYYSIMATENAPKLAIFGQWGNPGDYQSMRYGLTSCLMNDGYYSFTNTARGYSGVVWFDEYNANLGQPTTSPPTAAWQNGVWRRDFSNGIALVNPKGNGARTVQLGGTFVKIRGTQAPSVNNGQSVTSVTLQDRDGIILLRQSPMRQPKAPTGVSAGVG